MAHRALWLCIHGGEAGWHQPSDARDSRGVPIYWGGLQMSYGWLKLIPGRASDLTPLQQMRAAERGFRLNGYSRAWLVGQWPRSSLPCLGLT